MLIVPLEQSDKEEEEEDEDPMLAEAEKYFTPPVLVWSSSSSSASPEPAKPANPAPSVKCDELLTTSEEESPPVPFERLFTSELCEKVEKLRQVRRENPEKGDCKDTTTVQLHLSEDRALQEPQPVQKVIDESLVEQLKVAYHAAMDERQKLDLWPSAPCEIGPSRLELPTDASDDLFLSRRDVVLDVTVTNCPSGPNRVTRAIAAVAGLAGVPYSDVALHKLHKQWPRRPPPGRATAKQLSLKVKLHPMYELLIETEHYRKLESLQGFLALARIHEKAVVAERKWNAFNTAATADVTLEYDDIKPPGNRLVYTSLPRSGGRTVARFSWTTKTIHYPKSKAKGAAKKSDA